MIRGILDYQVYNSPFDEVDYAPEADEGFLPLFSAVDPDLQTTSLAPTLVSDSQAEVAGAPVSDLLRDQVPAAEGGSTRDDNVVPASPTILPNTAELNPEQGLDANLAGTSAADSSSPDRKSWTPEFISIPSIQVQAPIVPVAHTEIEYKRQVFQQWQAPDFYAAGWHNTSARLGAAGNTVLNGHHNAFDEVFRDLIEVQEGDLIHLTSGDRIFTYQVGLKLVLNERFKPVDVRLANAQWILPSQDERLTLISCWPYESNTHRVILVAIPTATERLSDTPE
jgi:LPXTG-site transpeptidase (sortase) family protein